MARRKLLTEYKEDIQSLAALAGVITVLLYVFGYVAERVHWNLLGIIQVPADHIEFLYRGGNVIISSLASVALYFVLTLLKLNFRMALLIAVIMALLFAVFIRARNIKVFRSLVFSHPRDTLRVCFLLLVVLCICEFAAWPDTGNSLLFQTQPKVNMSSGDPVEFFQTYVGLMATWMFFYLVCRRVNKIAGREDLARRSPTIHAPAEGDETVAEGTSSACSSIMLVTSWGWVMTLTASGGQSNIADGDDAAGAADELCPPIVVPRLRRLALIISLSLFAALPLAYGSFRFPNEYPIVQVRLAQDAPAELKNYFDQEGRRTALLYETSDEYVLYSKMPQPTVLQLKKSDVSGLLIYQSADISALSDTK